MGSRLILAIALLYSAVASGQDVHLTQFYAAQQNLNPALIGQFDGDYRIAANYRSQWSQVNDAGQPLTTTVLGGDKKFFLFSDEISAGLLVINDQFTGFETNINKIILSGSYKKTFGGHNLRGGIQLGGVFKSTNLEVQTFPSQWNYAIGEFDPTMNSGEGALANSQAYFDMNMGFAWSKRMGKLTPTVGLSFFHLNAPKDTYQAIHTERLKIRKVLHAEVEYALNGKLNVEPKLMYMFTTKAQDLVVGSNFRYEIGNAVLKDVYIGAMYRDGFNRNNDAVMPVIGAGVKHFDLGFSYDLNISNLSDGSYSPRKSTIEFSLVYTAPLYLPQTLSIPCDRY